MLLSRLLVFPTLILMVLTPYLHYAHGIMSNRQFNPTETEGLPIINDPDLKVETVFEGLEFPTTMAFLGPDDILVLEKNSGTVQRIIDGNKQDEPVVDLDVAIRSERGLLGIAVATNSTNDKTFVFLYFTKFIGEGDGEGTKDEKSYGNSVYRYELLDGKLVNPKLILDLPSEPGPAHNAGAITIGPDNNLYIPIGDIDGSFNPHRNVRTLAQNFVNSTLLDGRAGILRVDLNGNPVNSQGILGDKLPLSLYYAYGIRNSFGIDFDPVTGRLWDTENGPGFGDEINLVEPGFNSGWHKVQGIWPITNYELLDPTPEKKGYFDKQQIFDAPDNLVDFNGEGRYSNPELTWNIPRGITAIKFLNSEKLGKQYENDMFVGDYLGALYHFDLNKDRTQLELEDMLSDKIVDKREEIMDAVFVEGFPTIVDIEVSPDGYLYVLSYDGSIQKVVYQ